MLLTLKYLLRIYYNSVLWFIKYNEFSGITYKYLYLIIIDIPTCHYSIGDFIDYLTYHIFHVSI